MGPFAKAVTDAGTDGIWEGEYYCGNGFDPRRREVYLETRQSAIGPEWGELQGCVVHHGRNVRRVKAITA